MPNNCSMIGIAEGPSFMARIIAAHSRMKGSIDLSRTMSFRKALALGNDEMMVSTD